MKRKTGFEVEKEAKKWLKKQYPDAFIEGPPVRVSYCRRDYFGIFDFLVVFPTIVKGEAVCGSVDLMGVQVSKKYLSSKSKEFKEAWKNWPGSKLYLHWKNGEFQLK